ncbi:MAG: serine/threonine protein kinase [Spirochaeta sp.]|nr:serine/threonine protein kinase [Spirochaeta sp.]
MAKAIESIGKYRVLKQLAQGGMGAVYTAQHPTLDRTVIIKKLTLRGSADIRERFRREAQIMMDLRNDAIVDVYDHFREGSSYYIVLEYVDGLSLENLIQRRRYLPSAMALLIVREVCRGLAYAHERGVVHRDIKPANILISNEGEVKLVDFGIATIHGSEVPSELTREGMTLGTPSYMAPEQFHNTRAVNHRADIYSVGVVLYEMVTGKKPYPASFSAEVVAKIQKGRYPRPRGVNPKVSAFAARLIRRLLKPRPERRFSDLEQVIRRINRHLRLKPHGRATAQIKRYLAGEETAGMVRRSKGFVAAVLLVCALPLVFGAAWGVRRGYHRELFMPGEYGALHAMARVRKTGKDVQDIHVTGYLFEDDNDGIPALPNGRVAFAPVPEMETRQFYVFRAPRRLLLAGAYRLKVETGSSVSWHSFELSSLRELSNSVVVIPGRPENAQQVSAEFIELLALPLTVEFDIRDRKSGRRLGDSVQVWVYAGSRRRAWNEQVAAELRSGNTYRFRFEHTEYRPQEFSLAVGPEQSRLLLNVGLVPKTEE